MATTTLAPEVAYRPGFRSAVLEWVTTTDHKKIGVLYITAALGFFVLGGLQALAIRSQLAVPNSTLLSPETYNEFFTIHGTTMIFLFAMPILVGLGNYVVPLQLGAPDMAFPRVNALSFWLVPVGGLLIYSSYLVGGASCGWTCYAPLSTGGVPGQQSFGPGTGAGIDFWTVGLIVLGISSVLGAINFLATIFKLRAPGLTLLRLPIFVWTVLVTQALVLFAMPVFTTALALLYIDRHFTNGALLNPAAGGSALLWQHMFWFFGHPEVYIAILPGMGLTSHILSTFARKPVFGYRAMVYAIFAIGLLGFFVWGHHMFVSGMSPYSAIAFSLVTLTIGVPSAIKTFNWLGTLWGGQIRFTTPMLFALGFVSLFVSGGITGLFLGQTSIDIQLHDTYFVVGHFHLIMGVAAIFGMFAGTYFWFPKMFGKMMNETLGKIHFVITFIGVNAIFIPMHIMGMAGATRRYAFHYNPYTGEGLQYLSNIVGITRFVSYMAFITIAAQLIFVANLIWSWAKGRRAEINPWEATSLEWTVPSPPPHDNFGGHEPEVYRGPYEFSVPGAPKDYVMQTDPEPVGAHGD